jgi:hypothetical protein
MSKTNDTYESLNRDVMKAGGPTASDGRFKQWLRTKEGQAFQERWDALEKRYLLEVTLPEDLVNKIPARTREASWGDINRWLGGQTTRQSIMDSLALLDLEDFTKAEVRMQYQIKQGMSPKTFDILNDKKVKHSPFRRRKCRHRQ